MRVVVPQPPRSRDVAVRTLAAEGLDFDVVDLGRGQYAYGRLLRELWGAGEGFVLVEHDLAPWPGAIAALAACDCLLGGYDYMRGGNSGHALGLTKFSDKLLARAPEAWKGWGDNAPALQWDRVEWISLDGAVFDALAGYGFFLNESVDEHPYTFHVHTPPVAHARREP